VGFRAARYDVPPGSCAGYHPECNPLLYLWHHAARSQVPSAKSIPVRIRRSPKTITWSKQSRRIEPIARSQYPFCQGERAAVGRSRMPIARIRLTKASPYTRSRSRNRYFGGFSQPIASVTCCAIHSAVGCAVTPNHRISRRSCRSINRPNRSRNDSVGTTNRSSAAIPSA
jgi:hypothetical protein